MDGKICAEILFLVYRAVSKNKKHDRKRGRVSVSDLRMLIDDGRETREREVECESGTRHRPDGSGSAFRNIKGGRDNCLRQVRRGFGTREIGAVPEVSCWNAEGIWHATVDFIVGVCIVAG